MRKIFASIRFLALAAMLVISSIATMPVLANHVESIIEPLSSTGLDEDATAWNAYLEGNPTWTLGNTSSPSLDGKSLRCAITGGDPYSNVHCYRNLPADAGSSLFVLSLSFLYRPVSSFNNVGEPSIVQGLEFTMNKWDQDSRYEWALQWDNVDQGAPKWRYWDPAHSPKWVDLGISGPVAGGKWHTLMLEGDISNNKVHYRLLVLDRQVYQLNVPLVMPASTPGEPDRLAVAVQLDGNSTETPYELFIDRVSFETVPIPDTMHAPILLLPKNNYSTNLPAPAFQWTNPRFGDHYEINFAGDAAFTQNTATYPAAETNFSPGTPFADGKYYWRVRAYNINNQVSNWSAPSVFFIDTTPPPVPSLIFPIDGASVLGTPRFTWSSVGSAARFQFQIDNDSDFSSPVYSIITRLNFCRIPALHLGAYYWHVRAQDAAGNWSNWSAPFTIHIVH